MGYYTELARKAEKDSKWWDAWRYWNCEGRPDEAEVCKTIAEAIDKGNLYRELVGDAHERWKNHEINNRELYEIQTKAHEQVYGI